MVQRSQSGFAWTLSRRNGVSSCVGILLATFVVSGASSEAASLTDTRHMATASVTVDLTSEATGDAGLRLLGARLDRSTPLEQPYDRRPRERRKSRFSAACTVASDSRASVRFSTRARRSSVAGLSSSRDRLGDAHIAYVKQARRYGLKTFFPGPVYLEPWIGQQDVDAYADWAMAMLRRWRAAGARAPVLCAAERAAGQRQLQP